MPPFAAAVLAGILSNLGAAAASPAAARIRAVLARTGRVAGDRYPTRRAPQVPAPRVELTAPVSWGPPVPATRPGTAGLIAGQLASRASRPRE